jgi:hypothetical protein
MSSGRPFMYINNFKEFNIIYYRSIVKIIDISET